MAKANRKLKVAFYLKGDLLMNKAEKGAFMELMNRVKDQEKRLAFTGSRVNELMDRVDKLEERVRDLEKEADTGSHEEGLGWNANGEFCGECSAETCRGCVNEYTISRVTRK